MNLTSLYGTVLFSAEVNTVKDLLVEAVKAKANLQGANLYGANLYGANLYGANLYGANLYGADLREANLSGANLYGADLREANLSGANLYGANLYGANLQGANLYGADLREANLYGANLQGANLYEADLPPPQMVLLAYWKHISMSDQLTADLMEYDAASHPNRKLFDDWAQGGPCPYQGISIERAANFQEKKELWGKGALRGAYSLMMSIFAEAGIKR